MNHPATRVKFLWTPPATHPFTRTGASRYRVNRREPPCRYNIGGCRRRGEKNSPPSQPPKHQTGSCRSCAMERVKISLYVHTRRPAQMSCDARDYSDFLSLVSWTVVPTALAGTLSKTAPD